MLTGLLAAFISLFSLMSGDARWACSNDVEIWCGDGACSARPEDEMTPMDVRAEAGGAFSVCAYSGCWEGAGAFAETGGRLVWTAEAVPFSTRPEGGFETDVTLLIVPQDGVGFVRAGGLATPLICAEWPLASTATPAPTE